MCEPDFSGWLVKRGHLNKTWKQRFFTIRGSLLSYYESEMSAEPKGYMLLYNVVINNIYYDEYARNNCFSVTSNENSLILQAASEDEANIWKSKITNVSLSTKVIKSGTFEKLSSDNKKWDKRFFILVTHLLVYFSKENGEIKGYCDLNSKTKIIQSDKKSTFIESSLSGKKINFVPLFSRASYAAILIENQLRQLCVRFYDYPSCCEWFTSIKLGTQSMPPPPVPPRPSSSTSANSSQKNLPINKASTLLSYTFADESQEVQRFEDVSIHMCPRCYSSVCLAKGHNCTAHSMSPGSEVRATITGTYLPSQGIQFTWLRAIQGTTTYVEIPNSNQQSYIIQNDDNNCIIRVRVRVPFNNNSIVERISEPIGPVLVYEQPAQVVPEPKPAAIPFPSFSDGSDIDEYVN
ncbi:hypothetical protein WA158_006364 [Blastocystis sp. Blastoise]